MDFMRQEEHNLMHGYERVCNTLIQQAVNQIQCPKPVEHVKFIKQKGSMPYWAIITFVGLLSYSLWLMHDWEKRAQGAKRKVKSLEKRVKELEWENTGLRREYKAMIQVNQGRNAGKSPWGEPEGDEEGVPVIGDWDREDWAAYKPDVCNCDGPVGLNAPVEMNPPAQPNGLVELEEAPMWNNGEVEQNGGLEWWEEDFDDLDDMEAFFL